MDGYDSPLLRWVNISQNIESIAPHSGIAISGALHHLVCEENDIYSTEYINYNSC